MLNFSKLIFVVFFLSACTTTSNSTKDRLSKDQKADLYLQMGVRYLELGKLKTAKENLYNALAVDSNNVEIQNALAALHERLNQKSIAEQHYVKAIDIDPNNVSILNNYGRLLCDSGKYEQGKHLLKQALALPLNDRKWFAYTHIGRCELKLGNEALAEKYFRQALQENQSFPPALYEMQKISFNANKLMSARAFLERYLQFDKHNAETLWVALQTEKALGNEKEAQQYREMLTTRFPVSKEALQLETDSK